MTEYTNIADMFARMNKADCEYVVLRNYDNLLEDEIYMAGHGDIDLLCRDVKQVVDAIDAKTCRPQLGPMGDNIHFFIVYKGKKVSIDIRSVGDNYYCEKWEEAILKTRVPYKCFYVMNEENHLYSLIYHAIFQKTELSSEYQQRLSDMIGKGTMTEYQLIDMLEIYMRKKGYNYVFARDFYVRTRMCMHDKSLLKFTWAERWPHIKFDTRIGIIDFLVKIKHSLKI